MTCSKCGAAMADTDTVCAACGQTVAATVPAAVGAPPPSPPMQPKVRGAYDPVELAGRFVDPETKRPLTDWGRRVIAYLIDFVIVLVPVAVLSSTVLHSTIGTDALLLIANFLYGMLLVGHQRGMTVGMRFLHMQVRDATSDTSIGYRRAAIRYLVIAGLSIVAIVLLVDFLSPLWDARRQAWHDHAANSLVVDTR